MKLHFDARHTFGSFTLDARFEVDHGLTVLFGRSGSGKTTIIDIIGGLIRPDHARVLVDETPLVDTDKAIFVPKHKRRLGYVFQEARLFPHLTVRQNLLYGRWFAPPSQRTDNLGHVAALLGLEHLLERRPANLSGGEKQRVAIGRALLASPRLLLMDEPLSALDDPRKQEILPYLERLRDEGDIPIVYVSHAITEVARLATNVVLLADGKVAGVGPPTEILQRSELMTQMTSSDRGALIDATITAHDDAYGLTTLTSQAGEWRVAKLAAAPGTRVRLWVRASDVMLSKTKPTDVSALNVFPALVKSIAPANPAAADVCLDCHGEMLTARLTRYSVEKLGLHPGQPVFALIKSVAIDQRGWENAVPPAP